MKKLGLGVNPLTNMWADKQIWPFTLWDITSEQKMMRVFKAVIGDQGEFREDSGVNIGYMTWFGNDPNNVSIFNPGIIAMILALYGPELPKGGNVYDPFGGGGTRALACASNGFQYVGVEIRDEEVQGLRKRLGEFPHELPGTAHIIHGDGRDSRVETDWADFIITCPPYYDLEPYNGGPDDISMNTSYDPGFLNDLEAVVYDCRRILKPGGLAFWVVGLHRDKNTKELLPINHDLSNIHREYGWHFREEIILHRKQTSAAQRVGMFNKGNHLLIRNHEYLLIYRNDKDRI
jgi:tRNA1(Val) A37 N6-methylase TrmN6